MIFVMFRLINEEHEVIIRRYLESVDGLSPSEAATGLSAIIDRIRRDIPAKKRISLGRYSITRDIGLFIYPLIKESGRDAAALA